VRKFEYIAVTRETLDEFELAANRLGALGWELVGFQRVGAGMFVSSMFKRELSEVVVVNQGKVKK
jgi:hypothetical protein